MASLCMMMTRGEETYTKLASAGRRFQPIGWPASAFVGSAQAHYIARYWNTREAAVIFRTLCRFWLNLPHLDDPNTPGWNTFYV